MNHGLIIEELSLLVQNKQACEHDGIVIGELHHCLSQYIRIDNITSSNYDCFFGDICRSCEIQVDDLLKLFTDPLNKDKFRRIFKKIDFKRSFDNVIPQLFSVQYQEVKESWMKFTEILSYFIRDISEYVKDLKTIYFDGIIKAGTAFGFWNGTNNVEEVMEEYNKQFHSYIHDIVISLPKSNGVQEFCTYLLKAIFKEYTRLCNEINNDNQILTLKSKIPQCLLQLAGKNIVGQVLELTPRIMLIKGICVKMDELSVKDSEVDDDKINKNDNIKILSWFGSSETVFNIGMVLSIELNFNIDLFDIKFNSIGITSSDYNKTIGQIMGIETYKLNEVFNDEYNIIIKINMNSNIRDRERAKDLNCYFNNGRLNDAIKDILVKYGKSITACDSEGKEVINEEKIIKLTKFGYRFPFHDDYIKGKTIEAIIDDINNYTVDKAVNRGINSGGNVMIGFHDYDMTLPFLRNYYTTETLAPLFTFTFKLRILPGNEEVIRNDFKQEQNSDSEIKSQIVKISNNIDISHLKVKSDITIENCIKEIIDLIDKYDNLNKFFNLSRSKLDTFEQHRLKLWYFMLKKYLQLKSDDKSKNNDKFVQAMDLYFKDQSNENVRSKNTKISFYEYLCELLSYIIQYMYFNQNHFGCIKELLEKNNLFFNSEIEFALNSGVKAIKKDDARELLKMFIGKNVRKWKELINELIKKYVDVTENNKCEDEEIIDYVRDQIISSIEESQENLAVKCQTIMKMFLTIKWFYMNNTTITPVNDLLFDYYLKPKESKFSDLMCLYLLGKFKYFNIGLTTPEDSNKTQEGNHEIINQLQHGSTIKSHKYRFLMTSSERSFVNQTLTIKASVNEILNHIDKKEKLGEYIYKNNETKSYVEDYAEMYKNSNFLNSSLKFSNKNKILIVSFTKEKINNSRSIVIKQAGGNYILRGEIIQYSKDDFESYGYESYESKNEEQIYDDSVEIIRFYFSESCNDYNDHLINYINLLNNFPNFQYGKDFFEVIMEIIFKNKKYYLIQTLHSSKDLWQNQVINIMNYIIDNKLLSLLDFQETQERKIFIKTDVEVLSFFLKGFQEGKGKIHDKQENKFFRKITEKFKKIKDKSIENNNELIKQFINEIFGGKVDETLKIDEVE